MSEKGSGSTHDNEIRSPSEDLLRRFKIIPSSCSFDHIRTIPSSRQVGREAFVAGYRVSFRDSHGVRWNRLVAGKTIVTGPDSGKEAQETFGRLQALRRAGARVPTLYGLDADTATIYQEFIPDLRPVEEALDIIRSQSSLPDLRNSLVYQMILNAVAFDASGFDPVNPFYTYLSFNRSRGILYVSDAGSDLRPQDPLSLHPSYAVLSDLFEGTEFRNLIYPAYMEQYGEVKKPVGTPSKRIPVAA